MARRSNSKRTQTARRNVRLQTAPQRNAVNRAEKQSSQDYLRAVQAASSAYGGYQNELQDVPKLPLQDLTSQLQGQLGKFHEMLGGVPSGTPSMVTPNEVNGIPVGMPQSEIGAGTALYSQLGDNGFNTLAGAKARDVENRASGGREGALAERYAKQNLIQDLQDQLEGFASRRMDIADLMPGMMQQEMDRLQSEAEGKRSERALMEYLTGQIRGDLRGGGGDGRPGPSNGPGNGPGPGPRPQGVGTYPTDTSVGGNNPVQGGDTDAGGNAGTGSQPLSQLAQQINTRVGDINQAADYEDIPLWLRRLYNYTPEETPRWGELLLGNYPPRKKQIFRRTRRAVEALQEGDLY